MVLTSNYDNHLDIIMGTFGLILLYSQDTYHNNKIVTQRLLLKLLKVVFEHLETLNTTYQSFIFCFTYLYLEDA